MPSPIHDEVAYPEVARSILGQLKRTADANAVLSRPPSRIPALLVPGLVGGAWFYLQTVEQFAAPLWVSLVLVTAINFLVLNMIESFSISRRLEAAITLLQQQQDRARQIDADS